MDVPSLFISAFGLVREPVREASIALNGSVVFFLFTFFLAAIVTYFFREQKRIMFIIASLAIALFLGYSLKLLIAQDRPCVNMPGKIECPQDFSTPSLHSLVAFTLAVAALGNRSFAVYLAYAVFIAFSRVYLGVHTITDVASGLALAFFACVLAEILWKWQKWEIPMEIHVRREAGRLRK